MKLEDAFTTTTAPVEIVKTEDYDVNAMRFLLGHPDVGADDKRKLEKLSRGSKNGRKNITYTTYSGFGINSVGRYYVKNENGLQCLSKDCRNALARKLYWDIDIENCHPNLMVQLCQELGWSCERLIHYCQNRDECLALVGKDLGLESRSQQKDVFISILFGSTAYKDKSQYLSDFTAETKRLEKNICSRYPHFYEMVKKKKKTFKPDTFEGKTQSVESATVAIFLQTIERSILMCMNDYFRYEKRNFDVLIHDGGLLRKNKGEQEPPLTLLKKVQDYILAQTGFDLTLTFKPMTTCYEIPEEDYIYPAGILINDSFAAKKFAELCGDRLCKSGGVLYCFDSETGLWSSDNRVLRGLIHDFEKDLLFRQYTESGISTRDYGGTEKNIPNLISQTYNYAPDKEFDPDTAIGKLLFTDGIYDFDTDSFTTGFDPDIHFCGRIERPFPKTRDSATETLVRKILFQDPYLDEQQEQSDFFRIAVARALYGDYRAKRAYISVGEPNCGRGLLTEALKLAFGSFVATFSSNHLLYNARSSDDLAKQLAWFLPLANTRLAIANEISMNGKFVDSNILKSLSSGGDTLDARLLNHNIEKIVPRTTLFMLTNDLPQMKPTDKGLLNRLCVNELKKFYVQTPDPTNKYQAQEDRTLKDKFKNTEWLDALFWILADTWKEFAQTDRKAPKPAAVEKALSEWIETGTSIKSILEEKFEITKQEDDIISFKIIKKYLKDKGCADSDTKIGKELTKITGYEPLLRKIGGIPTTIRRGLKKIQEEVEFD